MVTEEEIKIRRKNEIGKMPPEIMDDVIFQHSHDILLTLIKKNDDIRKIVEVIALDYIVDVDDDAVADDLFTSLNGIPIEYIWDHSGGTRDGYVDPNDLAWELFEEKVESFLTEAKRYHDLNLTVERNSCFRGVLKGLYRFEKESNSEYKKWVPDAPREFFDSVREEWEQYCNDPMKVIKFIQNELSEWYKEQ